jgi:predicted RNA-binding protein with PIN domain
VPYLIDGNNLLHAAWDVGDPDRPIARSGLCRALGGWAERKRESVLVVFDGPAPPRGLAEQVGDPRIEVRYSGRASADDVLIEFLDTHSAARRMTVVSSDRRIAAAARRRRARSLRAGEFWTQLVRDLTVRPKRPREPREKAQGLDPEGREHWLREFGLDQGGPEELSSGSG